jgi:ParB family transcriptional regulator, chromosome partitioning protein
MHQLVGSIEDINICNILPSSNILRSIVENLDELTHSIKQIGLLQPIIVRTSKVNFEIIAGNRRFEVCKRLGFKKVRCHIVELDDKTAFEVSLVENVHRQSLNPIEEGLAFKKYVHELGWGGVSELAQKICKSPSYVSRRIKLVNLPKNILDLISQNAVSITTIEEMFPIGDDNSRSMLTKLIHDEHLSSRTVRKLVKGFTSREVDMDSFTQYKSTDDYDRLCKSFDMAIIALRICINKVATVIEKVEDNWILYNIIMQHKHMLNDQVDLLIKQKIKYKKKYLFLRSLDTGQK